MMGQTRYQWMEVELRNSPIEKIHIYKKNGSDAYMRGFEILYRDEQTQVVNSIEGTCCGVVNLGPNDVLVGCQMKVTNAGELNPRQLGLLVMRKR